MLNNRLASVFLTAALIASLGSTKLSANEVAIPDDQDKEAPNILYVIPWADTKIDTVEKPKLHLHDLMGTLYDPQSEESLDAFHAE